MDIFKKELNFAIQTATKGAVLNLSDCHSAKNTEKTRENNSGSKRDNRKHLYHFVAKVVRGGIDYIKFETKDGIGFCPVANIESIKNQFDESLTLANIGA